MLKVVCIPAYNEGEHIYQIVKNSLNYVDIVIVCDDGSTDDTLIKAQKAGAKIIQNKKNLGKGASLKKLFEEVRNLNADVIVTIDGDGQFLPTEIPKLMSSVIENESDIVIGYRFDDLVEMPTYRKIGNKMLDKLVELAAELPFRDTQSGFRAYSKKAISKIQFQSDGFGADSEILVNASQNDLKISEEKVTVIYNTGGSTSTKNPVFHSSEVAFSIIELIALKRPLSLLGIPGIILMIVGIIFGITVVSMFNDTRYFSIPSTLISLGAFLGGLLLILMAVVLFSISRSVVGKHS